MQSTLIHSTHAPALLRPAHGRPVVARASKQQQQSSGVAPNQPAPVGNFKDLMSQYRSIVTPSSAPPASQKKQASQKPPASSSSSRGGKAAPRLKPAQHTSAAPKSSSKRAAAAGVAGTGASKGRPGGFAAPATAERSSKASKPQQDRRAKSSSSISDAMGDSKRSSSSDRSSRSSSSSESERPPAIPSAWRMPSNGKGFGSPAPSTAAAGPSTTLGGPAGSKKMLRIFRFGVEAAAVTKAVEACGWQARVTLVESIKQADLILAAKCSSSGKHRNLAQGEKAATNAGIPFVVVGRKLSPDNFRQALVPHVAPHSKEAAALAAAAKEAAAQAAANKAAADAFFQSAFTQSAMGVRKMTGRL